MVYRKQRRRLEYWITAVYFSTLLCFGIQVSGQIKYSVLEETKEGSVVGNIGKDLGLDISTLVDRRFRIVTGSKDAVFQVNPNNGVLFVTKKIDREDLCEGNSLCSMNVKIAVENPLEIHYVSIEITDVNDHAPVFPEKHQHISIAENTLTGADFQLVSARDPDFGLNSLRTYKLSHNEYFELEIRDGGEENKIPVLKLQRPLDRERQAFHNLVLTAVDGGNPPRSGVMNITISVLDNNDNRPIFSQDVYSVTIPENIALGSLIIKVNATDADKGLNGDVIFSFVSNLKKKVYETFEINKSTGEISVKGIVDFEDTEIYRADVIASDRGEPPMTTNCRVIIKVTDMNDNRPEIEVTSLSNMVPEDSKAGMVVSLISVTDKDSALNGKIACSLSDDIHFELKPAFQENMYSLVTKGTLDRELDAQFVITITALDLGQPALSSYKTLSIYISDVNDNPPEFSQNLFELYIFENNLPGVSIFSVSAYDKDENENALVSYQILRSDGAQDGMASFLNINPETGAISALKSFDFETVKLFQFHILATDSGTPPLSSNVTVNGFVLDQNDNVPVILYPVSGNSSADGTEEIPRNVNAGHLVTKVRAYDADIGYNGWLLFSLLEVSDHSLFGLDRYTGQIRTLRSFTETDEAEHKLVILVKDNGNVSLSATATVIIKVVEPKEAFAASDIKNAEVKDEEENSVTFYLIITLSSVSVLFIISIIVLVVIQCSKSTDYSSKYFQETNYDGTLCHSIQYRSGDKRYMLVGPRMSIGSTIVPGSNGNTLVLSDHRRKDPGEVRAN